MTKKKRQDRRTWKFSDHICRFCGGRILQVAAGGGPSCGGNPSYKCADCCKESSGISTEGLCWCGTRQRMQTIKPYMCLPFTILEEIPDLRQAFLACGFDPDSPGEIGVVSCDTYSKITREHLNKE